MPREYAECRWKKQSGIWEICRGSREKSGLDAPTQGKNEMQCSAALEVVFSGSFLVGPAGGMSVGLFPEKAGLAG